MKHRQRAAARLTAAAGALLLATACRSGPAENGEAATPPPGEDAAEVIPAPPPAAGQPPDAERFLPPLPGYETDDTAEPGELESSLDHGDVPYADVRRRLILDDQRAFTLGEVTVVTVAADDAAERYLAHRFGDAARAPVRIGGADMLRIEAEPFPVLAWRGPGFVVTFARGQEVEEGWLEGLARATVEEVEG